jgi:hypothetical protein
MQDARSFESRVASASSLALKKARCASVISGAAALRAAIHAFAASISSPRKSSDPGRSSPVPPRCEFRKARVLTYPLKVDSQRVGQFAQRSHHAGRGVEADELQFAQFGWNFVSGNDL